MKVLGIETSGEAVSIALADPSGVVAADHFRHEMQLSQSLAPRIRLLLAGSGWTPADLDGVAASIGPGSFTGLRIGVTAAKSLAYALDVPAVAVPTLQALALSHPPTGEDVLVCAVAAASADDLFAALFQWTGGELQPRAQEFLMPARDLVKLVGQTPLRVAFAGSLGAHREAFVEALEGRAYFLSEEPSPSAEVVARIGREWLAAGRGIPAHDLEPRYLRPSAAEARRQEAACPPS